MNFKGIERTAISKLAAMQLKGEGSRSPPEFKSEKEQRYQRVCWLIPT